MLFIIFCIVAYFLGALTFSYWIPKIWKGVDVRSIGSRNVGASNAIYATNFKVGFVCFLFDFFKGFLVGIVMYLWFFEQPLFFLPALAVVLGHDFSIFLKGKGGKGIATSVGVLMGCYPWVALLIIGVWLTFTYLSRYVFIGSVGSFLIVSILLSFFLPGQMLLLLLWSLTAIIILTHFDNYQRFFLKKEFKISDRAKKQ